MKRRLRDIPPEQYEAKSAEICAKVTNNFANIHIVAAFASSRFEPSLETLWSLAFTREGHRLGRGAGFYDRFLGASPPDIIKAGICFDFQVVPELPAEPHDVRMDLVITG